jgi:hypothetical protein
MLPPTLKRDTESGKSAATRADVEMRTHSPRLVWSLVAGAAAIVLVGSAFLAWRPLRSRSSGATPIHSIAVLPFANASKDPEMDYLGEGIRRSHRWCRPERAVRLCTSRTTPPRTKTGRCERRVPCLEPAPGTYRPRCPASNPDWSDVPLSRWSGRSWQRSPA